MDAAVEMLGMLEANNYNSVTYSVLGNIYLDALAFHHYILSICEVLDSDLLLSRFDHFFKNLNQNTVEPEKSQIMESALRENLFSYIFGYMPYSLLWKHLC